MDTMHQELIWWKLFGSNDHNADIFSALRDQNTEIPSNERDHRFKIFRAKALFCTEIPIKR